jgi:hypothetical protein
MPRRKTRQNLESANTQVYAQKPPLKMPFKNSSPGAGLQFLQKTSRKNQYSIYPGNQHKNTDIRIEICGFEGFGEGEGDCGVRGRGIVGWGGGGWIVGWGKLR